MAVIRCGDGHGVDVLVRTAFAEIAVGFDRDVLLGEFCHLLVDDLLIHVAERHQTHARDFQEFLDVATPTSAKTDGGDTHVPVRAKRYRPGG